MMPVNFNLIISELNFLLIQDSCLVKLIFSETIILTIFSFITHSTPSTPTSYFPEREALVFCHPIYYIIFPAVIFPPHVLGPGPSSLPRDFVPSLLPTVPRHPCLPLLDQSQHGTTCSSVPSLHPLTVALLRDHELKMKPVYKIVGFVQQCLELLEASWSCPCRPDYQHYAKHRETSPGPILPPDY